MDGDRRSWPAGGSAGVKAPHSSGENTPPSQLHEIERVWVLRSMPVLPGDVETWTIEQGYLPLPTDGRSALERGYPEGRLRHIVHGDGTETFLHTMKRGFGLVREESERSISAAEFQCWWPKTAGRRIAKVRSRVCEGGFTWEVDRFRDLPLVLLEVELPDVTTRPALPAWARDLVVSEVTDDPRYRNASLALSGMPSPP
jgi:adenylate cyclase